MNNIAYPQTDFINSSQILRQMLQAVSVVEQAPTPEQAVQSLLDLVKAHVALIVLIKPDTCWQNVVVAGAGQKAFENYRFEKDSTSGILELALNNKKIINKSDCHQSDFSKVYYEEQVKAGLATPLRYGGKIVGAIGLLRSALDDTDEFDVSEIELLELYAAQIGPLLGACQRIEDLETAILSRDELLSVASHDLRNPLTALRGFGQLTLRSINKVPEGQLIPRPNLINNLQRMVNQSGDLDRLIGKLLDVSRINTGRFEIQTMELDLVELVSEAVARAKQALVTLETEQEVEVANSHTISLRTGGEALLGKFSPERIGQVVSSLIENAIKFSPAGGKVELDLERFDEHTAQLQVRDYGIGMSDEKSETIFQRWHHTRKNEGSDTHGLGLGLFIAQGIVHKHGGQIKVESELNQGSTFLVNLPLK